jgi:hypothetical protein
MTEVQRPVEGDSEIAAPTQDEANPDRDLRTADDDFADDGPQDDVVRTSSRSRPSNAVLLLGGVLVVVIAQLVMTWLVLSATTQLRDQTTLANGLQRCILQAQLNENSTTDPSGAAYRTAVRACVNK